MLIHQMSMEIMTRDFGKVNVDESQELALKYNIMSIPTLIFLKNGVVIKSVVGFCSKSELDSTIKNLL